MFGRNCTKDGDPYHLLRLLLLYHEPELCNFLDTVKVAPDSFATTWVRSEIGTPRVWWCDNSPRRCEAPLCNLRCTSAVASRLKQCLMQFHAGHHGSVNAVYDPTIAHYQS